MTDPNKITKVRVAEYFQVLFGMMVENGGSMPRKEILAQFPKRIAMTPHELSLTKSELPRWLTTMHMWSIDFQKAGFFNRADGIWTITDEGRRAFTELDPIGFFSLARERYAAWQDARDDAELDADTDDLTDSDTTHAGPRL